MESSINFHGYIALPLETAARAFLSENSIPISVTADSIETGNFVSVMALLLYIKYGSDESALRFLQHAGSMLGLTANQISLEKAYLLYREFECLFNQAHGK